MARRTLGQSADFLAAASDAVRDKSIRDERELASESHDVSSEIAVVRARQDVHFQKVRAHIEKVLAHEGPFDTEAAYEAGLITFAPDDLDWEDEIRVAIEERTSLSPDALTGMEASLRFAGPESMDTKIFGRLTAWQNWIFQRPNAVGPQGALTNYGKPTQAQFDFKRT